MKKASSIPTPKSVVLVAQHGMCLLALASIQKVFWEANRLMVNSGAGSGYQIHTVSLQGGPIYTCQGVNIQTVSVAHVKQIPIHTLILIGEQRSVDATPDLARLVAWLRAAIPKSERVVSVGSATLLLGQIGVFKGEHVTLHGAMSGLPELVDMDFTSDGHTLFTRRESRWSCAGGLAAIDLSLAVVEADSTRSISLQVARQLAIFAKRLGHAPQRSNSLITQRCQHDLFHGLHAWLHSHEATQKFTVERLAEKAAMSPRNFSRLYKKVTGYTPAQAVARIRAKLTAINARTARGSHAIRE